MSAHPSPRRTPRGWLPRQHGSWFMLLIPWLVGLVLAHRAGLLDGAAGAARWLLGPAWVAGYLAFNAATLMTKAAARRRPQYRPVLLTYAALAVGLGVAAVALGGPAILGWAPAGVVLVGLALWLTKRKQERSLLSGVVAVLAGAGVGVVVRFWAPGDLRTASPTELATLAFTLAYFVGTVLVVKTMIRERGHRGWVWASIAYHLALFTPVALAGWAGWFPASGTIGVGWTIWAGLLLVSAAVEPRLVNRLRPAQVGAVEIVASVLLLVLVLL